MEDFVSATWLKIKRKQVNVLQFNRTKVVSISKIIIFKVTLKANSLSTYPERRYFLQLCLFVPIPMFVKGPTLLQRNLFYPVRPAVLHLSEDLKQAGWDPSSRT
jgi:hypothetical protein